MAKMDHRIHETKNPSAEFINVVCDLYNDRYDDREEDSTPKGKDWAPGKIANHTSLVAFQKQLQVEMGISLSTAKIRKILITGGRWSTKRSREVAGLFEQLHSIDKVATRLGVTSALVTMYLPYEKTVYDLENKSGGAKRTQRWREKKNAYD